MALNYVNINSQHQYERVFSRDDVCFFSELSGDDNPSLGFSRLAP